MNNQERANLQWFFSVLRRHLLLILACTVLMLMAAFAASTLVQPEYESQATLLIKPAQANPTDEYSALITGERLALTYSQMAKSRPILDQVISRLHLNVTASDLAGKITVTPIQNTQLILLKVKSSTPQQAALIANEVSDLFVESMQTMQSERYTSRLTAMQDKEKALNVAIEDTIRKSNELNNQKIGIEVELARLSKQAVDESINLASLQKQIADQQSALNQLQSQIKVVEPARASRVQVLKDTPSVSLTLLVDSAPQLQGIEANSTAYTERMISTYSQMLSQPSILDAAIRQSGIKETADNLSGRVLVELIPGTQLIRISIGDPDLARGIALLNAITKAFTTQVYNLQSAAYTSQAAVLQAKINHSVDLQNQIQGQIKTISTTRSQLDLELAQIDNRLANDRSDLRAVQQSLDNLTLTTVQAVDLIQKTEPASIPETPLQSRGMLLALSLVIGMVIGVFLSFFLDQLDDRLKTPQDVTRQLQVNVMGMIGHVTRKQAELVAWEDPSSTIAEDFRMLSTNVRFAKLKNNLHTLMITSPIANEGKSFTTANLAVALAKSGLRVVLVDADFRNPRLHRLLNVEQAHGFTDALLDGDLQKYFKDTKVENLKVVTSGKAQGVSEDAIHSPYLTRMLLDSAGIADLVILDSPPVLTISDASNLAALVDGVLLVVRSGNTRGQIAQGAIERLQQARPNLKGVILNDVVGHRESYSRYYRQNAPKRPSKTLPEKKSLA